MYYSTGPVYDFLTRPKQSVSISLYPDYKTRGDVLKYLRSTGLSGWPHQSHSLQELHLTLLYNGSSLFPPDMPKEQSVREPIDLSPFKWNVIPLTSRNVEPGTPIAIVFKGVCKFKTLSDLFHKKLRLTPNLDTYKYHLTISDVQLFPRYSKQYEKTTFKSVSDYFKLPPYQGRMVFDTLRCTTINT